MLSAAELVKKGVAYRCFLDDAELKHFAQNVSTGGLAAITMAR